MIEKAVSMIGPLEEWERAEMEARSTNKGFGTTCYDIANMKQTSIPRTMKWLKMSAEDGHAEGTWIYGGLLYGLNPDLLYKRDEAAWWLKRVKDEVMMKKVGSFDSDGLRARRHVVRTLLSGSLSKNQDSVIYRSFFRSGLREVHLLPLISKYVIEEKEEEKRDMSEIGDKAHVSSLVNISSIILSSSSSFTSLYIDMKYDNQFLCFLPLLFSLSPNIKILKLIGKSADRSSHVDLSLLQQTDTSKLETLCIITCTYNSLSPLSLCDLSSLHTLSFYYFPEGYLLGTLSGFAKYIMRGFIHYFPKLGGLHPLNGLSSDITRSLKKLELFDCHLKDLSPLSDCDLSSLEKLTLRYNRSLSSLSPLRGSDLSSLKNINLDHTNISDISPLCECKGLALEVFNLSHTSIEDLSLLSHLDLSRLKRPINVGHTKVSDLSPLENISCDGVEGEFTDTPVMWNLESKGLKSPQMSGKVTVRWQSYEYY